MTADEIREIREAIERLGPEVVEVSICPSPLDRLSLDDVDFTRHHYRGMRVALSPYVILPVPVRRTWRQRLFGRFHGRWRPMKASYEEMRPGMVRFPGKGIVVMHPDVFLDIAEAQARDRLTLAERTFLRDAP